MKHIVVILTHSIGRFYIRGLLEKLSQESSKITLITFFNGQLLSQEVEEEIRPFFSSYYPFSPRNLITRFWSMYKSKRQLTQILSKDSVDIFIQNPNESLTNWLCYDQRTYKKYEYRLHLLPEGISNFYYARITKYDKQSWLYRFSCLVLQIPYKQNAGAVLGLGQVNYVDYWFTKNSGLMKKYMPVVPFSVNRPQINRSQISSKWLFLGQPFVSEDSNNKYVQILSQISKMSGRHVVYKPHPHEIMNAHRTNLMLSLGFSIESSDLAAENMALSYRTVVGVMSSTLLNLRIHNWHDDVRGIIDPELLALLLGRNFEDVIPLSEAAKEAQIKRIDISGSI